MTGSAVIVAVVKVREVRVGVGKERVAVPVQVPPDNHVMTVIAMMAVVVCVVVFVFDKRVAVIVLVVAAQDETDAAKCDHERQYLAPVDGFAKRQP
jgi:hypothetical protein